MLMCFIRLRLPVKGTLECAAKSSTNSVKRSPLVVEIDGDAVALRPGPVALPRVEEDRGVVPRRPAGGPARGVLAVRRPRPHALRGLPQGRVLLGRTPGI